MHIRKTLRCGRSVGDLCYELVTDYAVHYKGFVASGPDLGACIAACHGAANQKSV